MNMINDHLSAPCEVAIEITGRCNLNCKYCFNEKKSGDISLSKLKDILDQVNEMNVFEVCLSGGEPFIRKDIFEILHYAQKKDFDLSLVTNGTLLTTKSIKKLRDMRLINSLQVSVDSSNEKIHDSIRGMYSETLSSLKEIKRISSDLPIIGIVLHGQNYIDVCNSLNDLSEYCSGFHLMNVMSSKNALQHKDSLFLDFSKISEVWNEIDDFCRKESINIDIHDYDLKKKETARFTGCTAGKTKVVITPDLDVIPCDMARSMIIGNLNNQTLYEIWNSTKAKELKNMKVEPCYVLNKEWYNR